MTTACGSPCYAAPEMIAGKKYNGPSADIWSMGVILFALVSGYLPFEDANTSVLYKKILSGDYTPPKWLSSNVKDLMRRILETDPRKRYTLEDIRKHPWYNQVSDADIPKDDLSKEEQELTKTEVLKAIDVAGINKQAVLDGIASHCCNSLTAMYYLLEQKHRAQRLKETDKNGKQIQQNESNISNVSQRSHPETQTENNPTNGNVPVAAIGMKVQTIQEKNASNPIASKSLAMNGQQISQATKPAVPLKPYLQAPPILQQHMRQQQQYNNSNPHQAQPQSGSQMPSLDIYMQQAGMGNTLLAESDPVADNNSMQYQSVTKNNAGIPSLNLAAAAPQENRIFVSQTARAENAPNNLNMIVQPLSARPVLSSELANMVKAVPAELRPILGETFEERPNTRRSRNRSRGTPAGDLNGLVETMDSVAIGPLAVVPTNVAQNIVAVAAEISPTKIKTGSGLSEIHTVDMKFAAQAPNQPARSANAGRRGKNIQAPTGGSTNPSPRMMAAQIRKNQQGANAIFG